MTRTSARFAIASLIVAGALLAGCSSSKHTSGSGGSALVGLFKLTAGNCSSTTPTGTYFRMIEPGGTVEHGKYFANPDSTCTDKSITAEKPGTDGGLRTGVYQPNPASPFDANGDALSSRLLQPGSFTAIKFGISTNAVDPQTHAPVPTPSISLQNGTLSGQITAWSAAWNKLYFNQGSPKPDGSRPGLTSPLTGTYDATTHAFVITWASQVVGGPFNGFTGYWHLAGTFVATG